jgi:hypothetical protein
MMRTLSNIEYFRFEEDFVEDNLRCIPMIVRLKLDTIKIKLPLKAWSRFNERERSRLAADPCDSASDIIKYKMRVLEFAKNHSIEDLGMLSTVEEGWNHTEKIPESVMEKFKGFQQQINLAQWKSLTNQQRFALIKLSRPGHESKNFEKALTEFGLSNKEI